MKKLTWTLLSRNEQKAVVSDRRYYTCKQTIAGVWTAYVMDKAPEGTEEKIIAGVRLRTAKRICQEREERNRLKTFIEDAGLKNIVIL